MNWGPDQKDDAKQIECINNAVADQADAILLAANGPDADVAALKEADAAGVKIVYVDSPANYEGIQTLATDNKSAGKSGGEEMLKALEAAGITSGKIGIITPNAATNSNVNREMVLVLKFWKPSTAKAMRLNQRILPPTISRRGALVSSDAMRAVRLELVMPSGRLVPT